MIIQSCAGPCCCYTIWRKRLTRLALQGRGPSGTNKPFYVIGPEMSSKKQKAPPRDSKEPVRSSSARTDASKRILRAESQKLVDRASDKSGGGVETNRGSFAKRARATSTGKSDSAESAALGERALRTREHLIDTAKHLFLERGYGGTTIDHIAKAAGVSRASFYTYFPSKRDTLLGAAVAGLQASVPAIGAISEIPDEWDLQDLKTWLVKYLKYLDGHGAFLLVWSQAAWKDKELRAIGVKGSMRAAGLLGAELQRLGAPHHTDPRIQGQALLAMLDRFWYVWRVTQAPFSENDVIDGLANIMASILR
jgi:AcrR family transcriptional regulator